MTYEEREKKAIELLDAGEGRIQEENCPNESCKVEVCYPSGKWKKKSIQQKTKVVCVEREFFARCTICKSIMRWFYL